MTGMRRIGLLVLCAAAVGWLHLEAQRRLQRRRDRPREQSSPQQLLLVSRGHTQDAPILAKPPTPQQALLPETGRGAHTQPPAPPPPARPVMGDGG